MLIDHQGSRAAVDATPWTAPNAVLCGDLTVGPNCTIGFGVSELRAHAARVEFSCAHRNASAGGNGDDR